MRAMVLAAGLGTRLRPLTDDRPKALVEVAGRSMLQITLERLKSFGVDEVVVNVHHFADQVVDYLQSHGNFGMQIEISREDVLLDTGGGLKKAGWFFLEDAAPSQADVPFILHNVDVLSAIDLRRMVEFHTQRKALASLAVQKREASRYLLFDRETRMCGRRKGKGVPDEIVQPSADLEALAFSGVHVISPRLLRMWKEEGIFSIIDAYLRLAGKGETIAAFPADQYYWRDLGKPESVQQAAKDLQQGIVH